MSRVSTSRNGLVAVGPFGPVGFQKWSPWFSTSQALPAQMANVEMPSNPVLTLRTWPVVPDRSMTEMPLPSAVTSVVGFSTLKPSGP